MNWNRTLTIEELAFIYLLQCPHCRRAVPNYDFFTENVKCIWCDDKLALSKILKEKE